MKKVKFKIVSGDTTMQSYCSKTGAAWTFMAEDGMLLDYDEAVEIKQKLLFGPFGGDLQVIMIEVTEARKIDARNEWVDYSGSNRTADSHGLKLALIARGRALDKYEEKWDLLSQEIRNALVLS